MSLKEAVLDLLFPPKCPFCQRVLEDPRALLCPGCQPLLPWLEGKAGERRVDFTDGCFSPLAYRDGVPGAVKRYKFQRVRAYAAPPGRADGPVSPGQAAPGGGPDHLGASEQKAPAEAGL